MEGRIIIPSQKLTEQAQLFLQQYLTKFPRLMLLILGEQVPF